MGQEVFENAPDWAQWFAIDRNGDGYFYSHKPEPSTSFLEWFSDHNENFNAQYLDRFDLTGIDWRTTLIERQTPQQ
jgi:hypothetical protein